MPSSSAEGEHWNMPEDEYSWSEKAAASDASAAKHVQQTKKSWVMDSPPRSIDTSKKSSRRNSSKSPARNANETPPSHQARVSPLPASRLAPFSKTPTSSQTPITLASTPDTAATINRKDEPLPESYVTMIANAFGSKADLYNDVLGVSRFASPRAIRIAYFKKGRQVLSERPQGDNVHPYITTSATVGGQINEVARLRFQAVSMAYEIVSNPTWLDAYERCMLITTQDSDDQEEQQEEREIMAVLSDPDVSMSSTRSLAWTSAIRRVNSAGSLRSRAKSHTGVRWNEEVEELVFNQDPAERRKKKKKKSKKKKKKRIAIDEGVDLEKHLQQLDKEAEKNFVHDFLDDLEQSIDQLLSFVGDDNEQEDQDDEKEEDDGPIKDVSRQLFPEMETEPVPEELSTPKQPKKKRQVPNAPRKKPTSSGNEETSDIDDDDFELYKNHRLRNGTLKPLTSTNPFDDSAPTESDSRQEVAGGSQPMEVSLRDGSADADEDSYISFHDYNRVDDIRGKEAWGDNTPPPSPKRGGSIKSDQAHFSSKAPLSPEIGESASWHASPAHSPKRSPKRNVEAYKLRAPLTPTSKHQTRDPTVGELMFTSPDGEETRMKDPEAPPSPRSPKGSPRPKTRARSKEKKKPFEAPNDITLDDGEHTVDDSVSTLSASVVQRHINRDLTNSRYKKAIEMDKAEQKRERLKQTEKGDNSNNAVANTFNPIAAKAADETFEVTAQNQSIEVDAGDALCFRLCGDSELAETARAAGIAQGDGEDPSFTAFLMVYLNAMAADLARLGHSIQENLPSFNLLRSLEISDNDLDGMLDILETEMEEVPHDIAQTLSQEFLPSVGGNHEEAVETA